jgi:alpha-1,2-mannosyltransferase
MTPTNTAAAGTAARAAPAAHEANWKLTGGLLLAAAAVLAIPPLVAGGRGGIGLDYDVYRAAGAAVLHGASPYAIDLSGGFRYLYSPFAAMLMVPLAWLSTTVGLALWSAVSVLAMEGLFWTSLRAAGVGSRRRRAKMTLSLVFVSLPLTPVLQTLQLGQINFIIALLVLADLCRGSGRLRGVGVGIAAGIKLTPLIFIPYLMITRQYRAARVAAGSFLATVAIGFAAMPSFSWHYWTSTFYATSRMYPQNVPQAWNYSIREIIELYSGSAAVTLWCWLIAAVVVGVCGLMVARSASLRGNELTGVVACAITGLLISPISWPGHWVWCLPLLVVAAGNAVNIGRGRVLRAGAKPAIVYWIFVAQSMPVWPLFWRNAPQEIFTYLNVMAGLAVLGVLAAALRRQGQATGGGPGQTAVLA